jgi:Rps23 Pro-64 3,4-dihydroxylase Tpa1-like proline 4-hydroxylase
MSKITNLENYFYINKNSLSVELCKEMINIFEMEQCDKYEGVVASGLKKDIKDTIDFQIPTKNENNKPHWSKIRTLLDKELTNNVKKYIKYINECVRIEEENSSHKYQLFTDYVTFETMQMQRYTKNKGRYVYHNDFVSDWRSKKYRVITFLWYLNDVEEGGETEFWASQRIKPEAGKLLLFPATWTYPHRGMMPISNDKYIVTGWIYTHDNS